MRNFLPVCIAVAMLTTTANAQKPSFDGQRVFSSESGPEAREAQYPEISRQTPRFDVYRIDDKAFFRHVLEAESQSEFQFNFGDQSWDFVIWKNELRAPQYVHRTATDNGIQFLEPAPTSTYAGYVNGDRNNWVRINIRENHIEGIIHSNGVAWSLQSVSIFENNLNKNSQNDVVVYKVADLVDMGVGCGGHPEAPDYSPNNIREYKDLQDQNQDQNLAPAEEKIMQGTSGVSYAKSNLAYKCVEIAIAGDYGFINQAGGATAGETRLLDIFNYVDGFYDQHELDYKVVEVFTESSNQNTWGSSNSSQTLLDNFTSWGPNGFSVTHDQGSLYSTRDFDNSGVIGLAWLTSVCTNNRYGVMEYYSGWGNNLQYHSVDQTHEMGHNWSCDHDNSSSTYIMYPSLSGSNQTWGSQSTNSIANHKSDRNCLDNGECVTSVPPVADFVASVTDGCGSLTVQFTDQSTNAPNQWAWKFGDNQTSTQQNPSHTYSSPGNYTVELTATNSYGNNTETKTAYITVGTGSPYASAKGGPADNSFGGGGYFTSNDIRGIFFDAKTDIILESVWVDANSSGTRTIDVIANATANTTDGTVTGTLLVSKDVSINSGQGRVTLNFDIPQGNNYFIKVTGSLVDMYRNNAGPSYPYNITDGASNNLVDLTKSNVIAPDELNYYYYFYDWSVRKKGCTTNTGLNEPSVDVAIYPNPAHQAVYVRLGQITENAQISLLNAIGQTVSIQQVSQGQATYSVQTGELPEGVYLLKVQSGQATHTQRIVVSH